MGRQICVEVKDLVKAKCTIIPYTEIYDFETIETVDYIKVTLPDGREIHSYCDDMLVFDCRNYSSANYWMELWLIDNNVAYVAG